MPGSTCKSCNAPIIWIKFNGKNHPIDAAPRTGFRKNLVGEWEKVQIQESHFATCPDAAKHRKRGRH